MTALERFASLIAATLAIAVVMFPVVAEAAQMLG
jgi:hypothetical protein